MRPLGRHTLGRKTARSQNHDRTPTNGKKIENWVRIGNDDSCPQTVPTGLSGLSWGDQGGGGGGGGGGGRGWGGGAARERSFCVGTESPLANRRCPVNFSCAPASFPPPPTPPPLRPSTPPPLRSPLIPSLLPLTPPLLHSSNRLPCPMN